MKRNNYFILFLILFGISVNNTQGQHIDAGPDQLLCNGNTVNLHADISQVLTGRYRVESIPFNWEPVDATDPDVLLNGFPMRDDDTYSDPIDLPFPVSFYGNTYDKIVVGSNGDIIFEPSVATEYDSWSIDPTQLIPDYTLPYWSSSSNLSYASIMGAYYDIDVSINYPTLTLKYKTVGTAPNRKFIIIYKDIPQFDCNNLLANQQIVFNENDHSFEVHIKNRDYCDSWNNGLAVLGTQNEELVDTCGNYPGDTTSPTLPNRNTGTWTINSSNPEAYKFVPDANATANWYDANRVLVGTGIDVTVPVSETSTFSLEVTFEDCHGNTFTEFDEVTVTVVPEAQVNLPVNEEICQGDSIILDATVQNPADFTSISYEWTDSSGNVLGTDPQLTVDAPGDFTVNITLDGCVVSYTNVITQYPYLCEVPGAISPNDDGKNDQWVLDYLANRTGIEIVEIFDRRGVLVYDKENYRNEFIGKNNDGNDLPAAAYYYVIKLKDDSKLTGWLYLTR